MKLDIAQLIQERRYYPLESLNDPEPMMRAAVREAPSTLVDYINAISDIQKPHWMEEADKAHTIRLKRNTVHAKLCMKDTTEINAATCRTVIEYLTDILSTRYPNLF